MDIDAFQLSRIYAQGWNDAKKLLTDGELSVDEIQAASLNPHRSAPAMARWAAGFEEALQSRTGPATRGGSSWRPTVQE